MCVITKSGTYDELIKESITEYYDVTYGNFSDLNFDDARTQNQSSNAVPYPDLRGFVRKSLSGRKSPVLDGHVAVQKYSNFSLNAQPEEVHYESKSLHRRTLRQFLGNGKRTHVNMLL